MESTIATYKKILSDGRAIVAINSKLKRSGILEKAYYNIFIDVVYAIRKESERMETFFTQSIPMSLGFGQIDSSEWSSVKKHLAGLERKQLEEYANQFSSQLIDNPNSILFLVLSLPKWKYD